MPVPGPRTQFRPDPGYNNPGIESPDRFNFWKRPGTVSWPGRSPGLMVITLRGNVLGAGQVRRLWMQAINYMAAQAAYSWTENFNNEKQKTVGVDITRALRYKTQSFYAGQGIDNSRFLGLHTVVPPKVRSRFITIGTGLKRNAPTTRNRISSFGSRVPPLNPPVQAAEGNQ